MVCLRGSEADKGHKFPSVTDPLTLAAQIQSTLRSHWLLSLSPELGAVCTQAQLKVTADSRDYWCNTAASHIFSHMTAICAVPFLKSCAPGSNGTQVKALKNSPLHTILLSDGMCPDWFYVNLTQTRVI